MAAFTIGLLALLSIIAAAFSAPALLYGVYPEDAPSGTNINSVSIDPATGVITDVCNNFFQAGVFEVNEGVSALDAKTGVYMYATDWGQMLAYQTNVYQGKPLKTLDLGAEVILHFTADPANGRFLVLMQNGTTNVMQVVAIDEADNKVTMFASPPDLANLAYASSGFIDPKTGNYVILASTEVNVTTPKYRTFTWTSDGAYVKTGPVIHTGGFQVIRAAVDPTSSAIVALMQSADSQQFVLASVDANGHSNVTKITSVTDGNMILCGTFSVSHRMMYFIEGRLDGTSYLHSFSVESLTESVVAVQGEWYFFNLECSA
eukprot:TRINITY_DN30821_c0_g1_i1.p1 TRINITY_DN30821_c0_g1~~TRINITY_DN30821_c0_g1_i1.p1  ORF type:complete len:329 (-),score=47.72 TRINITY_DN30821_c0_g1_i1:81-1034(-)